MLRRSLAFLAAATMATAPVIAQAAPAAAPTTATARAGAPTEEDSDLRGGSFFAPAVAAIIIILGILVATGVILDNDHPPVSP